jgi:hypothetical protein
VIGELLLFLAAHLLLTALPFAAAALLAAHRGVDSVPLLLVIGLAASGTTALLGFWAYYADPVIGETFSYLLFLGSTVLVGWALADRWVDQQLLRQLATPLALWGLGSAFLVFLGFVHGGTETPLATATTRFSHQLPTDNLIPFFYVEWFFDNGHHGKPPEFPGEWLSSDRPPLQAGYGLWQHPFGWDAKGLSYQVMAIVLQQLWIVGLWALMLAGGVGRLTRGLTSIAVLLSSLAIVNGFFVWPKMLPAAMLLGAATLVMTPLWSRLRTSLWAAALFAALCGVAMLGHGSSVFGVIPLLAVAAYRGLPSWRWIGVAALVGIVFMGSWSAFQKYEDPPGNRLAKWTLAGEPVIDDRGTLETVVDAYGDAGLGQTLDNKWENFVAIGGGKAARDTVKAGLDTGDLTEIVRALRVVFFLYLLPSLGLLLLAPLAMILGRRNRGSPEFRFALTCFVVAFIGVVAWALISFGNEAARTILHVSSYLLPILAMAGAVAGLRAAFPRFALWYVGLASALSLALYAPVLDPVPGTEFSIGTAVLAAIALVVFAVLALAGSGRAAEGTRREAPPGPGQVGRDARQPAT